MNDSMTTNVAGNRTVLLMLVLKTSTLMLLTAGIYSFWARTRLRRWLWSAVRPGGMPLEYTGHPVEKLMGFVLAAVLVAFYVGLVVMILIYYSISYTQDITAGMLGAVALLVPVYFMAKYRGRRYLLSHTSWRGLSFSMEPGAGGYVLVALFWTALSIVSLGLLWPFQTFYLQRYMVNRTWFGDRKFVQGGSVGSLYGAYLPYLIGVLGSFGAGFIGGFMNQPSLMWLLLITVPLALIGWVYYQVAGFRIMASNIALADGTQFDIFPRTGRIIRIHIFGNILIFLILSVIIPILLVLLGIIIGVGAADLNLGTLEDMEALPPSVLILAPLMFYLAFFVLRGALKHVFITYPLLSHALGTLRIDGSSALNSVGRGQDRHMHDADGFANIFDFGGGI